jgi:hypothetical protein
MNKNNTVTIGGKKYDSVTGLPVASSNPASPKQPTHAAGIHASPQRSQTLVRRVIKKPTGTTKPARKPGQTMDIARSRSISRFAPHPVTAVKEKPATVDIPATKHPLLARTRQAQAAKQAPALTSREVKEQEIAKALATETPKVHKKKFVRRHPRFVTIASISVVVAVAIAYVVYLNMPALSVRVAATQAGINATYPQYQPDGYSLDGPVTYTDGAVSIHFAANTGTSKFDITQAKSSWDSTAVLDNLVKKAVGDSYITSQERGLTIYTYGSGDAAWVNAGILYTIVGDAPLSGDQIRHIATSL